MRRILILGLMSLGAVAGLGQSAKAQSVGAAALFNDPFLAYYGYFIPQQLYQASRPRVEDTVQQFSAARQYTALTERSGLYDPIGALGIDEDPFRAFGSSSRLPRTYSLGLVNNNLTGNGPGGYYNRVNNYYPTLRMGRGGNGGLNPISTGSPRNRNLQGVPNFSNGNVPGMPMGMKLR
ncbi:MAG TPA: hypothetical protein VFT74_08970 [Isosphaeraceae bacterium]|nr:hypothetical protein [Isosphaeraceae bacterium]